MLGKPSAAKMAAFPVKALREATDWESRLPGGGFPNLTIPQSINPTIHQSINLSIELVIEQHSHAVGAATS